MKHLLHNLHLRIKVRKWNAKLQRMTDERRESFETEQYRRRRKAALKHEPRSWA